VLLPALLLTCLLQKFEEMMSKYDKDNKGGLTFKVRH
jgi:hypothetical protein